MAKWCAIVLLCLALGAASIKADKVTDVLNKKGLTLAAALWDIAGVADVAAKDEATWTAFAPTDAAIKAFLGEMGLSVDELKARPGLAKEIVGVHLILRHNVRRQELFALGDVRIVNTAAGRNNNLVFVKDGDKVTVTAAQGVSANVDADIITVDEQKTFHVIDKVLMGSGYYTDFASLCLDRAFTISDFCEAAQYAGFTSTLAAGLDATLFIPNNAAFSAAGINLGVGNPPAPEAVADILNFHVLAGGATPLPKVKAGDASTLAGKSLTISYVKTEKDGLPVADAFVNGVKVLVPNVYVGKAIVNGIGAILKPGVIVAATPAATTSTAAAGTTTSAATGSSDKTTFSIKKGSLTITLPRIQFPEVHMQRPTAAAAHPISINMSGKGGRKMLGFGWGAEAGGTANIDNTIDNIDNVVDGNESAVYAADQATLTSEELSIPGDWNQVDNGVNPW